VTNKKKSVAHIDTIFCDPQMLQKFNYKKTRNFHFGFFLCY